MSSLDHDGLGRYGDPLCPDGDLLSIDKIREELLTPGGVLILSVPVGPDLLAWNLHRRYGPIRLPLLLDGWDVVDKIGWKEEKMTKSVENKKSYEPIFILKKPKASVTGNDKTNEL